MLRSVPNLATPEMLDTFLSTSKPRLLSDYGIDEVQAADLRARLSTFEEDWNRPDMDGYNMFKPPNHGCKLMP